MQDTPSPNHLQKHYIHFNENDFFMNKSLFFFLLLFTFKIPLNGQNIHYSSSNVHSHNDYEQDLPFYAAYARGFGSIEADLWAVDGELYVAHHRSEIEEDRTFQYLYLDPLLRQIRFNKGKAYPDGKKLQLLIDLKSPYHEALPILLRQLDPYRHYFDLNKNTDAIRLVISGQMPPPDRLHTYDSILTFDGRPEIEYPEKDWERVVLISANVQNFISWNKQESISGEKKIMLQEIIDEIHRKDRLIRFWAVPDTENSYEILMDLGVDYIGTDDPEKIECLLRWRK